MSDRDVVDRWLSASSPPGAEFGLDDLGVCLLSGEDGHVLRIEVPDAGKRFYLCSYLGRSSGIRDAATLRWLLEANFLTRDTDGATLSIDARADQVALCFSQAVADCDAPTFERIVANFLATALRLKGGLLAAMASAEAPVAAPEAEDDVGMGDDVMIFRM